MGKSKQALTALAAVAAVAVLVFLIACGGGASADEVRFENVSEPGPKPFTTPTDVAKATSRPAATDTAEPNASSGSESSARPAERTVCDRERLIAALIVDPAKLSAFADAVEIDAEPQPVADFIRKLRPVTLTRDTQVTNHFYDDGSAEGYQAILQKGTAVLVDEDGEPIVRCRSGSPLSEPVELEKQTKCINCPANYRPPPPCEGKCYRPEPNPPPVKPGPVTIDPIVASKAELEKCRKDKGGLEQCKTEYEKTRKLCEANPLNPACDSSVCFDAVVTAQAASSGCSSYIDRGDILGACLKLETAQKQACLKKLDDLQKQCAAQPSSPKCTVDPKIKIYHSRRQCTVNGDRPECKAVQVACAKTPEFGCEALQNACVKNPDRPDCKAVSEFKQACSKDPKRPECKDFPKTAAPTLQQQARPDAQEGDPGTGAEGTDEDPGGGEAPGTGGETPQPEKPAPQPEKPSPPEGE